MPKTKPIALCDICYATLSVLNVVRRYTYRDEYDMHLYTANYLKEVGNCKYCGSEPMFVVTKHWRQPQ